MRRERRRREDRGAEGAEGGGVWGGVAPLSNEGGVFPRKLFNFLARNGAFWRLF